jgi:hypothetical protein
MSDDRGLGCAIDAFEVLFGEFLLLTGHLRGTITCVGWRSPLLLRPPSLGKALHDLPALCPATSRS